VLQALVGATSAAAAQRLLRARPPLGSTHWDRTNHRGATVSLLSGPALALAVAASADLPRVAAVVAALGAGAVGAYDDVAPGEHAKGLRGHATALRQGRVTGGSVKVVGIGAAGLLSARLAGRPDVLVSGAVVAASANLLNLLDLRPGRALKAGGAAALALGQPGPAAAAAALLPDDLHERTMLGDAGANALGAVLGLALLRRAPSRPALGLLVLATAASEVVSYSRVIDAVPPLRWADRVGRLP
jgi:UDP-N-acetylmuramyl pentapeptide phosphotransferase/UDP-N-acetylglucosamine-1-phosphate transferase